MAENPNTVTGQNRVIRKKGDLTGSGKGDWLRIDICDEKYKKNYDKIFGKRNIAVENKVIADESDRTD
tara:strand:- start:104 stop:307 length:204 start_codon:yes stop_codon:yes gene_type:complete